ncbi:hypothetical protein G6F40_017629 [Rhizopus arrhizus]|nr:hypothetical protein G6F40_017629 [Rhizopus arrhizus]
MVVRLGDGTAESHAKMQAAIDDAWRFTGELFADDAVDQDVAARGIGSTLAVPVETAANHLAYRGGRQGKHTEELGYMLAEMQYLPRAYPGATW